MPCAPFTWPKAGLQLEIGFGDLEQDWGRLSHPMDPRTVPLYVPREDRELVTNARCIADVDDKV